MKRYFAFACLGIGLAIAGGCKKDAEQPVPADPVNTPDSAQIEQPATDQPEQKPFDPASLPDTVPALRELANEAYYGGQRQQFVTVMEKLHRLRPFNSEYMYQLVLAYALIDEKSKAYNMMLIMQRQGLAFDFNQTEDSANIRYTKAYEYINDVMVRAGKPVGEAEEVFTLPAAVAYPEALDWDATRNKFLIGTVGAGQIVLVGEDGRLEEFIKPDASNQLRGVFDIAVDAERDRLWVSTTAAPQFYAYEADEFGHSALVEFELSSGKFLRRYASAAETAPHVFANLVVNQAGDVFVADGARPMIHVKRAGEDVIKPLVGSPRLVSIRGLALSEDNRYLYVADYELGLFIVDLEGKKVAPLKAPETLNQGGIDGIYLWQNHLVVIQNGTNPQRIMRLQLNDAGTEVSGIAGLVMNHVSFDGPNYGVIRDDDIYYFASSHWGQQQLAPIQVMRSKVSGENNIVSPEFEKFIEERQQEINAKRAQQTEES